MTSRWPRRTSSTSRAIIHSPTTTSALAAVVFLDINRITVERESGALYELTMGVAEGRIDKPATAAELERVARGRYATCAR